MKYATWTIYFPEGQKEGYTADQELQKRGFEAYGLFEIQPLVIFGKYQENADISNLDIYAFQALTDEEAVNILEQFSDNTLEV